MEGVFSQTRTARRIALTRQAGAYNFVQHAVMLVGTSGWSTAVRRRCSAPTRHWSALSALLRRTLLRLAAAWRERVFSANARRVIPSRTAEDI